MAPLAVLFDLDGTLFDHPGSARRGLTAWLAGGDLSLTEDLAAAWFAAESRHWAAWREGLLSFTEQRRARLRDFLPLVGQPVGDDVDLDEVFAGYSAAYRQEWSGYDDVVPVLLALEERGVTTGVLTNGSEEQQRAKLDALGLLDRVGPVFTAEALGLTKPDPRAFLEVCRRMGLDPASVLYVGDDHEVDVVGARAAGLRALHLDRVGAGPDTEPWRTSTLAGVLPFLRSDDGADDAARPAGADS